ncbi:hypothetical protein PLESTB_001102000 [Pleodorina starrii]|uniref:SAM domain-containing protein n=1 Tax=Pleodorina starrii TaxID=330485 RepID=A0A9W6BQA2_9CHLO|nr:hypothetical protein PLESTB_001102000 [Pleodorina starrii]
MTGVRTGLPQSGLDETGDFTGASSGISGYHLSSGAGTGEPHGLSSASRLDASGFDGNASIAYSDATSDQPSKARSSRPARSTTSDRSTVALSQSNLASSAVGKSSGAAADEDGGDDKSSSERGGRTDDGSEESSSEESSSEESASVSGSVAVSERSAASKLCTPASRSQRTTGAGDNRLASEANFGLGGADDDAASAISSKSSSVAHPYRSPSLTSGHGHGSKLVSESSLGRSMAVGDDDNGSVAASAKHGSKPKSSPAPSSRRAPSGTGGDGSGSRAGSDLAFSGFSMGPSGKSTGAAEDDNESVVAATDRRSPAPSSQRAPSASGGTNPAGGSSRKPTVSGGVSGYISNDDESSPSPSAPATRRRSSFASSLRQSVASHKTASPSGSEDGYGSGGAGGGTEADGEGTSTGAGLSQSRVGDDATSTRSGYSAATSANKGGRSGLSGVSGRSGRSTAPSSHTVESASSSKSSTSKATKSTGVAKTEEYGEDNFEEEEVVDDDGDSEEEEAAAASTSAAMSESVAAATSMASGRGGGGRAAASSKRSTSASGGDRSQSRQSTRNGATAAAASSAAGYSQDFDMPSASGRHSPTSGSIAPGRDAASAVAEDDGVGSSISAGIARRGAAHHQTVSVSGSIFQPPPSDGATPSSRGGRGGGSVFRRLPADAPDDDAEPQGSGSSGFTQPGDNAGDWNEGAVRVAAPGAPRPRPGAEASMVTAVAGARSRPMSAAPRDRQAALLDGLIRKHPATWDTVDVATWVDFLGLGQYRRRFLHHCIDGRLLLRLNDAQLKSDLGIGPMGHRCAILDAAANLIKNYKEAQRDRAAAGDDDDGTADGRHEFQRSTTAPRARPASARPGALSTAPPPPPGGAARRPASASRSVIPPDPFLGPAMGKQTVYEQRAKLLFELDRAQARAEQHRALADQLRHTAALSTDEVAHIRGLLVDIENKNRAAFELSGGVDSGARIPWRHVGNGTKHNNWNPERFARPGDPESVDMTFQPRTNAESRKIVGGGEYGENSGAVNSFLDRLNNDLRKREQTRKELEKRYYSDGSSPQTQAEQDFALVSEQLSSRLRVGLDKDPAEYDGQINEALDKLQSSESWREAGLRDGPIRAAKGPAKIAAFASALRSLCFMERYRSDLKSKSSRMQHLEKKWVHQTLGAQYLPGGKDKDDLEEAVKFFVLLGWRDGDGSPSEEAIEPYMLDRLLERALEYRKRFDAWWERVRDKPEERAAGFKCDVNWFSSPWDADGLAALMAAEMKRMGDPASGTAPPGGGGGGGSMDFVEFTVGLLGKCREDDLRRLMSLSAKSKRLGVYRAIRTQKFIEFTQRDLEERDRKIRQAYNALAPARRRIEPSRIEGFFERLVDDAAKRRAKAEKIEHDKVQREKEILASSVMYGRLRSSR